ncbi:LYR motif-containing protein [Acrasis kona]|uniref:LYR motif-containing protein n=1 Tax=Acrasis kona TaxID=1008807 RepID=A0AAW2ZQF8_9EUKA
MYQPFNNVVAKQIQRPYLPSLKLWLYILRKSRQLPKADRSYYVNYASENFIAFYFEPEQERVDFIIEESKNNIKWICKKYGLEDDVHKKITDHN